MGTDFAISSNTLAKLPNTAEKFSLPGSAENGTTQICSSSTPSRVTSHTLQLRPSTLSALAGIRDVHGARLAAQAGAAEHLLHLRLLLRRKLGHLLLELFHLRA
jgi:hypothetical protein